MDDGTGDFIRNAGLICGGGYSETDHNCSVSDLIWRGGIGPAYLLAGDDSYQSAARGSSGNWNDIAQSGDPGKYRNGGRVRADDNRDLFGRSSQCGTVILWPAVCGSFFLGDSGLSKKEEETGDTLYTVSVFGVSDHDIGGRIMKGSMTVEAVFVVSLLLLVILWVMKETILLYQQVVETAASCCLDAGNAASAFRKIFWVKEMLP